MAENNKDTVLSNDAMTFGSDEREENTREVDSKYRMILIAAQRSKQLQRGAAARVPLDPAKHKNTRIALEEVKNKKVDFKITEEL